MWYGDNIGCFCSENGCCQDFEIDLPTDSHDGQIYCSVYYGQCAELKVAKGTLIPLNINLIGENNITLEATGTNVISVIVTKLD